MPRKAKVISCNDDVRRQLERMSRSHSEEHRLVKRAKMVLGCIEGRRIIDIAEELGEQEDVIIKWRDRFVKKGIEGLQDAPRSGKPVTYAEEWQRTVLNKLSETPPDGLARWDGPSLAAALNTSVNAVQRFLQRKGIQLARMRSWCISTDPDFAVKAADIVGLYLNPPDNAIVLAVDEKPNIQALSRTTGYVRTANGKVARAMQSTYKRNGTLNLFAALETTTGLVWGKTTSSKKRVDFLEFMSELIEEFPIDEDTEFHVILDNHSIHKGCHEWLADHPNVTFHYTPTSASWLNMVEIWFSIMTRKVLKGASFGHTSELSDALNSYIDAYSDHAQPFIWKKREVKGTQIRDTLPNL